VLCQLLNIISDQREHLHIIKISLEQHLIAYPQATLDNIFVMNLRAIREESGFWQCCCLTFLEDHLSKTATNHLEIEAEVFRCIAREWKVRQTKKDLQVIDTNTFIRLLKPMLADRAKPQQTSPHPALVKEAGCHLGALAGVLIEDMLASSFSTGEQASDCLSLCEQADQVSSSITANISKVKNFLQGIIAIHQEFASDQSKRAAFDKLLEYIFLPSEEHGLDALPESTLIYLFRRLCNVIISSPTTEHYRLDLARKAVLRALEVIISL
jgi:hypothetical protein